jgi:hypothetical protein
MKRNANSDSQSRFMRPDLRAWQAVARVMVDRHVPPAALGAKWRDARAFRGTRM